MEVQTTLRRHDGGFTMIEVMAALGIFATVLVAVSSLSVATMQANRNARQVTAATNLARDKIEELRGKDYWTLTAGSDPYPLKEDGTTGGAAAIYYRTWYVWAGPTGTTLAVKVSIDWLDGTTQRSLAIRTIMGS